jgi:hypothetical protein
MALKAGSGMVLGMVFGIAVGHMVLGMVLGLAIGASVARRRSQGPPLDKPTGTKS